jgi:hypothetical protein
MVNCSRTDDMWGNIGDSIIVTVVFFPVFMGRIFLQSEVDNLLFSLSLK